MAHKCQKTYMLVLSSTIKSAGMVVNTKCGKWKCVECGEVLRKKWMKRATKAFGRAGVWQITVCNRPQFAALTNRLRRHERVYYRIRLGETSYVFHQPFLNPA